MAEIKVDASVEPTSQWFAQLAAAVDESDLSFALPVQRPHASTVVALAAVAADRRSRGLRTRVDGGQDLQPIVDLATARRFAEAYADELAELTQSISPSVVRMARFVFEELGANVVQHSGRAETGFGLLRVDPSRRRLELAFADRGVGFRSSLQRNPELESRVHDDAEALQLAVSPRITGTQAPRANMGIGLKLLTDFSDLLGGDLWIASGSAMLQRRTTAGQRTNVIRAIPTWRGSWISLDAPVN